MNQRQLIFCNEIFKGTNITDAAIIAGYSKKSAYSIGSELMKNPEITRELGKRNTQLQAKLEANQVMSKEERMSKLSEIAKMDVEKPVKPGAITSAISELNKMDGSYAPEKHALLGELFIKVIYEERKNAIQGQGITEGSSQKSSSEA